MPRGVYPRKNALQKLKNMAARTQTRGRVSRVKLATFGDPVVALLSDRATPHGNWEDNARIFRRFKEIIDVECRARVERGQEALKDTQREALEMIATKMSRVLCGTPSHADHWDDIEGYARLGKKGSQF